MAKIAIGADWFANVKRSMDRLQAATFDTAESSVSFLKDKIVEKAQADPNWSSLSDNITVWSQDGRLFIGVNNEEMVSEAMALEYGDEVRPPSALFRSLSEEVRETRKHWREEMESKGYTYGAGIIGKSM